MAESKTANPRVLAERHEPEGYGRDADFHAWLLEQSDALRSRRYNRIHWDDVAEELEAMAKRDERELVSHLKVLLAHLLKYKYQAEKASSSWDDSIQEARDQIADLLEDSPSLKQKLEKLISKAYGRARNMASKDMGGDRHEWLAVIEASCPWTFDQFMDENLLPAERVSQADSQ